MKGIMREGAAQMINPFYDLRYYIDKIAFAGNNMLLIERSLICLQCY